MKILCVVSNHTNNNLSIDNHLHSLKVANDGQLLEIIEPLQIPVANTIGPKSIAIFHKN